MNYYLDHNATTPLDERVLDAMLPFLRGAAGNASSVHRYGRWMKGVIEQAREQVAELVNAHPTQVIFTSGGSEANNLAIKGVTAMLPPAAIAISATEHDSVRQCAHTLAQKKWRIDEIPVDAEGNVLPASFSPDVRLVCIHYANNENGVVQAASELSEKAREAGAVMLTDAVQAAGKIHVHFPASGAHFMTLSSHKIYGPQGAGALIYDRSVPLAPLIEGGGQESGLRSGTENVAAIVGFGKAAELAKFELVSRSQHVLSLRVQLERGLKEIPGVTLFSQQVKERLPNTVMFAVAGIDGEMLLMHLDNSGFAVSSGSACHSGNGQPSHVLKAMQIPDHLVECVIRVSLGHHNKKEDISAFLSCLKQQLYAANSMRDR